MNAQKITPETLIPLFVETYQGSSTESVNNAFQNLLQVSKNSSNPFLNSCQKILQTSSNNKHLCQSVCNYIKIYTKIMTDQNRINQLGPKDFINKIQHIFDNRQIPSFLKQNIALSYIKAALHFRISLQRIVDRIAFLYKTKDNQEGILLSRAYLSCNSRIDSKSQGLYYSKILPLQLKYLHQEMISYKNMVSEGNSHHQQKLQTTLKNVHEVLKNIHSSLIHIAFQKFESSIFACLKNKEITQIFDSIQTFKGNKQIMIVLRQLIQKVVQSLFRMKKMQKLPLLMKVLSQLLYQQWKQYQQTLFKQTSCIYKGLYYQKGLDLEQEVSIIQLLTAAFNSHIILILDDNTDILNLIIMPLFEIRTQLFRKDQKDVRQVYLLFQDTCFMMKSQCIQVEFNRFVKAILINYQAISSKVLSTLDQVLFKNSNFEQFLGNDPKNTLMLLSLVAFQTSYFMTNETFIHKLEIFLIKYENILFSKKNMEIYFHSLLLLSNFLDDMFCQGLHSQIFYKISQNFIQNNQIIKEGSGQQMTLICYFERQILKTFFSAGFIQKQTEKQRNIFINYLCQKYDEQGVLVFIKIMKNYQIEDKTTLQIFDRILQTVNQLIFVSKVQLMGSNSQIYTFIQFLQAFFDIQSYKHLFEPTLSRILPIFEVLISKADQFVGEFFSLIKNVVKHLEYVPDNYYAWMSNLFNSQKLQSESSFFALATVLSFIQPSKQINKSLNYEIFINCIALHLLETLVKCNTSQQQINSISNMLSVLSFGNSQDSRVKIQNEKGYFLAKPKGQYSKRQLLALLCLHLLIYYHSAYFTVKILKSIITFVSHKIITPPLERNPRTKVIQKKPFSFVNGKYQLTFVLLFRRRLLTINQILSQFGLQKKVYDAVYMRDNQYLIEYDTPILIKEQVQIFKNFVPQDKLQLAYANTSFLTIFYKFFILFGIKKKYRQTKLDYLEMQSSDSDQEDFESNNDFKTNFKEVVQLVEKFPKPKEWKLINEINEIKDFIQLLRSNESSREWLNTMIEKSLTNQQKDLMQELMKDLCSVNGKLRHIVKINRNPNQH